MINNNPLYYLEQLVAMEDVLITSTSRTLRQDIGYDCVYLSSSNDFVFSATGSSTGLSFVGGTTHKLPIQSDWRSLTLHSSVANQIVYVMYVEMHVSPIQATQTVQRAFTNRADFMTTIGTSLPMGTFTRAATTGGAYHYNQIGFLVTANTNIPRIDFNPTTNAPLGLLLESTNTNYLLQSENFNNATSWTRTNIGVTTNTLETVSPTGEYNASKIVANNTTPTLRSTAVSISGNTTINASVFLKKGSFGVGTFMVANTAGGNILGGRFDLDNGNITYTLGTSVITQMQQLRDGWWRLGVGTSLGINTASTQNFAIGFNGVGASGSFFYAFGAMLTSPDITPSYIKTTTSNVTRAADVYTIGTSTLGFSTSLGSMILSFDGRIFASNNTSSSRRPLVFNSTPEEYLFINDTGTGSIPSFKARDRATNILFYPNTNANVDDQVINVGLTWSLPTGIYTGTTNNDTPVRSTFAGFSTSPEPTLTLNSQAFWGHVRYLDWFGYVLPDATLQEYTKR